MTVKARIKEKCLFCPDCNRRAKEVFTVVKGVKKELPVDEEGIFDLTVTEEEFKGYDFTKEEEDNLFFDPLLEIKCECGTLGALDLFEDTNPI